MNIEFFRDYCLKKKSVTEGFPFDNKVLVFKVGGKMFALTDVDSFESINLKCDPVMALKLREEFSGIQPGYHMNKKHWNTVSTNMNVPQEKYCEWIDHSYDLVVASLPKRERDRIITDR